MIHKSSLSLMNHVFNGLMVFAWVAADLVVTLHVKDKYCLW